MAPILLCRGQVSDRAAHARPARAEREDFMAERPHAHRRLILSVAFTLETAFGGRGRTRRRRDQRRARWRLISHWLPIAVGLALLPPLLRARERPR
jgi:hypothetical protein